MVKMVRWTPQQTATAPRNLRAFDTMFDELWNGMWAANNASNAAYNTETARPVLRPAMDVIEEENSVLVRLDLPGIAPEDVNIEVDGDLLTISGEIADAPAAEETAQRYTYRERRSGAFKRTLRLADTINTEAAAATFENGVLTLELPKQPEVQPKRIAVQAVK